MSLIILEGLDRTGKTTVADYFATQGFEVIHMSAPDKAMSQSGYIGPSYLDQMVELLTGIGGRNVVLDRSHYGELVWPQVYGRKAMLDDDDMEILHEIETSMGANRILMQDPNSEAHWQRCVDNNEPLTKTQFVKARSLYSNMADKYGFERKTLKDFPDAAQPLPALPPEALNKTRSTSDDEGKKSETAGASGQTGNNNSGNNEISKTKEQLKLERANVINEVLSKRILKGRGVAYDEIEKSLRHYLNTELGKILGTSNAVTTNAAAGLTTEEVDLLKFFCKTLNDKGAKR
jgi:hypothetical protein